VTLAQILYEEERKQSSALPLAALKDLINTSRERILSTLSPVTRLIARDGDGAVAEEPRPEEPAPDQPTPDAAETVAREPGRVQQFFEESRHAFEEWQHDADKRMKTFWEGINPAHQIQALQAEVKRLQARVDALEARLGAGESPAGGDRPAGEE
jgi:hypothetical protein